MNPNHGMAWGALGFAQARLGLNEDALASLDVNLRLSPQDFGFSPAQNFRAIALYQLGRVEEAIEANHRGLLFDPAHLSSLRIHPALCRLAGRADDASEAIRTLRAGYPTATADYHAGSFPIVIDMSKPTGPALVAAFHKAWQETPA